MKCKQCAIEDFEVYVQISSLTDTNMAVVSNFETGAPLAHFISGF
jgi:hypothetical protein